MALSPAQLLTAMGTIPNCDPATSSRFINHNDPLLRHWPPLVPNVECARCGMPSKGLAASFEATRKLPCPFKTAMADILVRRH